MTIKEIIPIIWSIEKTLKQRFSNGGTDTVLSASKLERLESKEEKGPSAQTGKTSCPNRKRDFRDRRAPE